jgi:hypothetical protein
MKYKLYGNLLLSDAYNNELNFLMFDNKTAFIRSGSITDIFNRVYQLGTDKINDAFINIIIEKKILRSTNVLYTLEGILYLKKSNCNTYDWFIGDLGDDTHMETGINVTEILFNLTGEKDLVVSIVTKEKVKDGEFDTEPISLYS